MNAGKPTYHELEERLAAIEPVIEALKNHEVDAVVGKEKIAVMLLREVGEALQISDAGFRAIFELCGVGMIQADTPALRFTRVNRKFCEITGFSAEELLTKTYLELTHPEDRARGMRELARVLRGKADSWSIEKRCIRKDGSIIWLGVNGVALRDDAGRTTRILAMIGDITAHKLAQRELRDRSKQLRKLAAALTRAEQRERRRIARMLHDHIEEYLMGGKRRKVPLAPDREKTVRQALKDVQNFIDQAIVPPPPPQPAPPR